MEGRAFFDEIDEKTKLAGSNKLELLLFDLGTRETFGINVFKIKEVMPCPKITRMPNSSRGMKGVFSLRGNVLPALDLCHFLGLPDLSEDTPRNLIVTEYSQSSQGFIVGKIDRIIRVDWEVVKAPKAIFGQASGPEKITAITELEGGRLVSILDVEQILFDAFGDSKMPSLRQEPKSLAGGEGIVFFADDSGIARRKISEVLDHLGVSFQLAESGLEAWSKLDGLATGAQSAGKRVKDVVKLILTDAEMPEMDGYVLTKKIKGDARFEGVPVVMHSSLSSQANRAMGAAVGVDGYVAKFDPHNLADAIVSRWS